MKQKVKLIVVIPVGPLGSSYRLDHLYDTVESVLHYTTTDRRIILQDSSLPLRIGTKVQQRFPEVLLSPTPEHYGSFGGAYKAESLALLGAVTHFDFQVLVHLDIDSLWTGYGFEDDAIEYFSANPQVGMLGGFPRSPEGYQWPRRMVQLQGDSIIGMLRDPGRYGFIHPLVMNAKKNKWQVGDHVLGGAAAFSPMLLRKLAEQGLLLREEARRLHLREYHIFSLLCRAVGMEIADFAQESQPMAVAWDKLPAAPETLVKLNKKIVHAVRDYQGMTADEVRAFFRAHRTSTA
jgi:hypothetical protein